MTLLSLLGRIMRYFLLRPETLFLLCISLALWSYFFHTDEVKTIVKSSRDAVKMVKGMNRHSLPEAMVQARGPQSPGSKVWRSEVAQM